MTAAAAPLPHGASPRVGPALFPDGRPSPNYGDRRDGATPSLVLIHFTAMNDPRRAAVALTTPEREVSAHYLITRWGEIVPMVDEAHRAWHAGEGEWRGAGDVNSRSIGIELDNDGQSPFPEPQMAALCDLMPGILSRWGIDPAGVIGHSDIAPRRKKDPGPRFDWRRLARLGLALCPEARPGGRPDPDRFRAAMGRAGYAEMPLDLALSTLRLRCRPWATGPLDATDMGLAAALAQGD